MSSTRRKLELRQPPVVADTGCGCRRQRRRPKLSSFFSSSSAATSSSHESTPTSVKKGAVDESEAVVKESHEPYADFRDSMVEMILVKEIYDWDELRELLHRFLALNAPYHHHHILRAFADICGALFAPPSPAAAGLHGARRC